ncbi:hypothetical protein GW17_00010454 [Ensete ventricosum]|nr:hypothetical protein GW17_00010454 [Ensete ventricosum]
MYISRLPPRLKLQLEYVAHIQRHATPTHASLVRWTRATSFGCLFKSAPHCLYHADIIVILVMKHMHLIVEYQQLRTTECFVFVYDVTIGYKHRCPTLIDNVFGVDPSEVHIHAQRILLSEIPTSEIEAAKWLIARFKFKDKLLADFTTLGYFPNPGTEGDLSTVACLAKCSMVMVLTGIFVYLTLFSSIWFKMYVSFSCASLSFATYFKVLPSPLLDCTKALFYGKIKKM